MDKIKAISLFSSAGIGEILLKNTNIEIYEMLLNNLWKNKQREYFSYKVSIYLIVIYVILNIISFILKGQLFSNKAICILYNLYWMILLILLINTYNFIIDKM